MTAASGLDLPTEESMAFGHLQIAFDERVLRPRPWTAAQSRWAADLLRTTPGPARVLELCAGAGHIGLLALALSEARHHLVAVDVNPVACDFVRRNAEAAGMAERVDVREGRIDDVLAVDEHFELVIADPPWVAHDETPQFPDDPMIAIDGGVDGLEVAWTCIRASESHLVPGGCVILQLGSFDQAHRVQQHLEATGSTLSVQDVRSFGADGVLVLLQAGAVEAASPC